MVDNAIKYTVKGGVIINIKYQISNIKNGENDKVVIVVRDTGIGIPPEKIKTLFDATFERGEEAKRLSAIGSGIGLYLSVQIIKSHNGKIWAESPARAGGEGEDKGSTFYIELPVG